MVSLVSGMALLRYVFRSWSICTSTYHWSRLLNKEGFCFHVKTVFETFIQFSVAAESDSHNSGFKFHLNMVFALSLVHISGCASMSCCHLWVQLHAYIPLSVGKCSFYERCPLWYDHKAATKNTLNKVVKVDGEIIRPHHLP